MADAEYRQLLRDYLTGKEASPERVIQAGLRSGATLLQFKQDGLLWQDISKYLSHWNRGILDPTETKLYQQMLIDQNWGHPDFINRKQFFVPVPASEDWYPNWPGGFVSMYIGFSAFEPKSYPKDLSARKLRKLKRHQTEEPGWQDFGSHSWGEYPGSAVGIRLAFWGADDFGQELNVGPEGSGMDYHGAMPYPQCLLLLDALLRAMPNPLTKRWLFDNNFRGA